jgi:hypothetical protein
VVKPLNDVEHLHVSLSNMYECLCMSGGVYMSISGQREKLQ